MTQKLIDRVFDVRPVCKGSGEQPYSAGEWFLGIISFGILLGKKSPCSNCEGRGHIVEEIYENQKK